MPAKILITGHAGLIGRYLCPALEKCGFEVAGIDLNSIQSSFVGDITREQDLKNAIEGCIGIVHLAAVSRVVWGQKNPEKCWQTNAVVTRKLHEFALLSSLKPWVITASSREVYGQPQYLPVAEDHPLVPMNVYAQSKVEAEQASIHAGAQGLQTAILRFSNVYGCPVDHADRVVPAFCRAAMNQGVLRVEGSSHQFDFTYIDDAVAGIIKTVKLLMQTQNGLPAIQLASGTGTSLQDLSQLVIRLCGCNARVQEFAPRDYDVSTFVGCITRAKTILEWTPKMSLEDGLRRLISKLELY